MEHHHPKFRAFHQHEGWSQRGSSPTRCWDGVEVRGVEHAGLLHGHAGLLVDLRQHANTVRKINTNAYIFLAEEHCYCQSEKYFTYCLFLIALKKMQVDTTIQHGEFLNQSQAK